MRVRVVHVVYLFGYQLPFALNPDTNTYVSFVPMRVYLSRGVAYYCGYTV